MMTSNIESTCFSLGKKVQQNHLNCQFQLGAPVCTGLGVSAKAPDWSKQLGPVENGDIMIINSTVMARVIPIIGTELTPFIDIYRMYNPIEIPTNYN